MVARFFSRYLLRFLGLVLVVAASLKATELVTETNGMTMFTVGLISFEIALGLWLLSGFESSVARVVALVCFASFFGAALVYVMAGRASCGCTGKLQVSPWCMAAFDLIAVGLLSCWRSPLQPPPSAKQRVWVALVTGLGLSAGTGVALLRTEEASNEQAGVRSLDVDFGEIASGGRDQREVWVENHLSSPVTVTSVQTSCPCLTVRLRDSVIEPGARAAAEVVLDFSHEPTFHGDLRIQARGLTKEGTPVFLAQIRVRVRPSVNLAPVSQ